MAKKKHAKPHEEENGEAWLLPYSDLMTLLLALFIALFAISQTDQKKMSELAQAFTAAFNMGGPSFFDKAGPNVGRRAETPSDEDLGNSAYFAENSQLEEIQKKMQKTDAARHMFYEQFTGKRWGESKNYTLSLDTGILGYDTCVQLICDAARKGDAFQG